MRREIVALLVAATAMVAPSTATAKGAQLMTSTAPQSRQAADVPCFGPALICAGKGAIDAVGGVVGDVAGDVASEAADATMGCVVSWAANGAALLVKEIAKQV
jgi:hypothetical protein